MNKLRKKLQLEDGLYPTAASLLSASMSRGVAPCRHPSGFFRMWENVIPLENLEPIALECRPIIQNEHHLLTIHEGT
jgi:hypothetical protein